MPNEAIRGHLHKTYFSLLAQTAFGTPPTTEDTTFINCVASNAISPPNHNYDVRDREGVAGNEFPECSDVYSETFDWSDTYEMDTLIAAWIMAFAMGETTNAGAGPFTNTLKFHTGNQLPLTGLVLEGHFGSRVQYNDMWSDGFSVAGSGEGDSTIQITGNWMGSGDNSTPTFTPKNQTCVPRIRMGRLKYEIGNAGGALTDISDMIESFNLAVANNSFSGHRPGGNLRAVRSEHGNRRQVTGDLTLEQGAGLGDLIGDVAAQTLKRLKITCFDDTAGTDDYIEFEIPQLTISDRQRAGDDRLTQAVTLMPKFDPARAGYDAGNQGSLVVTVSRSADLPQVLLGAMT